MHEGQSEVGGWPTPVPWTVADVLLSLFFVFVLWGDAGFRILQSTGFYRWYYGPNLALAAERHGALGLAAGSGAAETLVPRTEVQNARVRMGLWVTLLAFPCQVASVLLIC